MYFNPFFPPLYYYLFVIFFVLFCPFTLAKLAIGIYSSKKLFFTGPKTDLQALKDCSASSDINIGVTEL